MGTTIPKLLTLLTLLSISFAFEATIVAIGASITYGLMSSHGNGYRDDLAYALRDQGNQIHMVGTQKGGDMDEPFSEGYPGRIISEIKGIIPTSFLKLQRKPNVIVTLVGTNDMKPDAKEIASAPGRFNSLIDTYFSLCAGCTVIVSALPPNGNSAQNKNIVEFNGAVRKLVEERGKKGQKLLFSDGYAGMELEEDMAPDKYHPNDRGYTKLGLKMAEQVQIAAKNGWLRNPDRRELPDNKTGKPFIA